MSLMCQLNGSVQHLARQKTCWMSHNVAAGHPTQCQNSQGTIQQEEIDSLLSDCIAFRLFVSWGCSSGQTEFFCAFDLCVKGGLSKIPANCFLCVSRSVTASDYSGLCCYRKLTMTLCLCYEPVKMWDMRCEAALEICSTALCVSIDRNNCIAWWISNATQHDAIITLHS